MQQKNIIRIALVVACIVLAAVVAQLFVPGFNWPAGGFLRVGMILFAIGLVYEFVASKGKSRAYRVATSIAVLSCLMLAWGTVVGGWIGGEDNPANVLYFIPTVIGIGGTLLARFSPRGMALAAFVASACVLLAPPVAFAAGLIELGPNSIRVFATSAFFAGLFALSGVLYRRAA